MRILVASDSFKGCLSSLEVALAVEQAAMACDPAIEVVKLPVADGGEGTVEAVTSALGGELVEAEVSDPLRRPVMARYGKVGDLAIIEVAAACGLTLLSPAERNPLKTDTYGVGELILHAIRQGCGRFLIGLGGSATNDGGKGMLSVPGFLESVGGKQFTVACDVDTPFVGPVGASRVFAPQKGASPADVEVLEERLVAYSQEIMEKTGIDVRQMKGAGAAGGLGGAFAAFLHADLVPGVEMVLDTLQFDEKLDGADLVLTGEGRSDFQTPHGKTPAGVLKRALAQGVPAILMSGQIAHCSELDAMGFSKMIQITPAGLSLAEAMNPVVASENIKKAVLSILK